MNFKKIIGIAIIILVFIGFVLLTAWKVGVLMAVKIWLISILIIALLLLAVFLITWDD